MKKHFKVILVPLSIVITSFAGYSLSGVLSNSSNENKTGEIAMEKDGINYINIYVKGGYSPERITARANQKTILNFITENTYDCGRALVIPDIKYEKILPSSGTTSVELAPRQKNSTITGSCSMGMYKFEILFI